ncbi:MAG: DUF6029 family protein [Bacteroidales bacterium]
MKKIFLPVVTGLLWLNGLHAQDLIEKASVNANFQTDAALYTNDKALGLDKTTLAGKRLGINGYTQVNYTLQNFSAGLRYEAFMPPMLGFPSELQGNGIAHWFVKYQVDRFTINAGNIYEQFGTGMILRTYEEWSLGYDNALNGVGAHFTPLEGITVKAVAGYQRSYWEKFESGNRGIVRGVYADVNFNEMISALEESPWKISLGTGFVSKYEKMATKTLIRPIDNQGSYEKYEYKLPANVGAWSMMAILGYGNWSLMAEYARKDPNPSALNNYIYRNGQALLAQLSYSRKGLGIQLMAKRIDNMGFKSRMDEKGNVLDINFLPPVTMVHAYSFANMYPYATQPNGEMAFQGQVNYKIPRNTKLGGKYGTDIEIYFARVNSIKKESPAPGIPIDSTGTLGYSSPFFTLGDEIYYQDLKVQVFRKFSSSFKTTAAWFNQIYNKDVIEGHNNEYGKVYTHIGVLDMTYKLSEKQALRLELEALFTQQDKGNWMGATLEYTIAPHWFFSVMDEYNYGNPSKDNKLHYYGVSAGYSIKSSRLSISYGRQREGLLCVGGICRYVPAYTGLGITITSTL